MRLFNLLNNNKSKTYSFKDRDGNDIKNIDTVREKLEHAYTMVKDRTYRENLKEFLTTIYSIFPYQAGQKRRMSLQEQLVLIIKDHTLYTNVSGYMFIQDLYETLYKEASHNFDRYMYLLDSINNNQIQEIELSKKLVWNFKNPNDRHLQCYDEVNILINKVGPLQLIRILELFYNLPVKKG